VRKILYVIRQHRVRSGEMVVILLKSPGLTQLREPRQKYRSFRYAMLIATNSSITG
jgi:hypothetical protein